MFPQNCDTSFLKKKKKKIVMHQSTTNPKTGPRRKMNAVQTQCTQ